MTYALHNQVRAQFARELDAIGKRARSRLHDPRAARLEPRPFTRAERLSRAEEAQRVVDLIIREKLWTPDRALDQWVERVYCAGFGMAEAGASAAATIGVLDVVSSANVVGSLQADLGITLATGVNGWASQIGGTTLDATQGTGGNQPAYDTTHALFWGRPAVTGDGSNDYLNTSWDIPATGTSPTYQRVVASRASWGTNLRLTNGLSIRGGAASETIRAIANVLGSDIAMANGAAYRIELLCNNSASDYMKVGSTQVTENLGSANPAAGAYALLATTTGTFASTYSISKLLALNVGPSALQRALLDGIDRVYYNGLINT